MQRDCDFRNQREKLDQKSAETKQNSKKNFGRKNFWPNFDSVQIFGKFYPQPILSPMVSKDAQ